MFRVEPFIAKRKKLGDFDCGYESLNSYLRTVALLSHRKDYSRTYLAIERESEQILGYYSLSSVSVEKENIPHHTSFVPAQVPGVHMGRLAVKVGYQGQGIGTRLLIHACKQTVEVSNLVGACLLEVHTNNEDAKRFYLKYGFEPYSNNDMNLYLEIDSIRQLATN